MTIWYDQEGHRKEDDLKKFSSLASLAICTHCELPKCSLNSVSWSGDLVITKEEANRTFRESPFINHATVGE